MSTGDFQYTDLYTLNSIVQNTMLSYPKELIIGVLRDEFGKDSYFHYVKDQWGYPFVPDHTDLPIDTGLQDDSASRLYISERNRFAVPYLPALIVSMSNSSSVPISMNREKGTVKYSTLRVIDGYGNEKFYPTPTHYVFAGAYEGTMNIDVKTKGIRERDELTQTVSILLKDIRFDELVRAGVIIKKVSVGSFSEADDLNDKIYNATISLDIRSEWRREVPVESVIDAINICVDFGRVDVTPATFAENLQINTSISLLDAISQL